MQDIHFDQDVQVWIFFIMFLILNIFVLIWIMTLSLLDKCLLFESMGYLYFFLFFSSCSLACIFFSHAFWHGHFSFLSFFEHSPYLSFWHMKFFERGTHDKVDGVFIWWMKRNMLCATLSVRVINFICGCTCVLIMGV